jgi:crotonobetainyl-CoA:carnitine CoA-transferase CaiB-like acyl-CoA transferase
MTGAIVHQQVHGAPPSRQGNSDPRFFPHNVYRTRGEDAWLAVAVRDDREWAALCAAIPALEGMAGLSLDGRRGRAAEIEPALAAWASQKEPGEAAALLQRNGVSAAASASAADLLAAGHLAVRDFFPGTLAGERPARLAAIPWMLDGVRGRPLEPAGPLGCDTESVLREFFGYDAAAVQALRAAGVVA